VRLQPVRFRVQPGGHDRRSPHDHVIAVAAISILPRQILSGYRGVLVARARRCAPVPAVSGGLGLASKRTGLTNLSHAN